MKSSHLIVIAGIEKSGKTALASNLAAAFSLRAASPVYVDFATDDCFVFSKDQGMKSIGIASITPSKIAELQREHDILVIDIGSQLTKDTASLLHEASAVLVPTDYTKDKLEQTRTFMDSLFKYVPRDIVYTVLSRYSSNQKVSPQFIKQQLGCDVLGAIAQDSVVESSQPMMPFVFTHPESLASKYVIQIVNTIQSKRILDRKQKVVPIRTAITPSPDKKAPRQPNTRGFNRFEKEAASKDPRTQLKLKVLKQLSAELNLKKLDTESGTDQKKMALLRQKTKQAVRAIMEREQIQVGGRAEQEKFLKEVLDEALGLGPLEELLADPSVTEIMVNHKDQIYIERNGKVEVSTLQFTGNAQLLGIIERIVAPLGRRIDEKTPYVDARLPDGSRVHAIIPPLALDGPILTIRKFPERNFTFEDLIKFGSMTEEVADFLRAAIESRLNGVVSGGTGSGKTTLLNVLSSFIPENERIVTVEDSAELRLTQPHVLRLESRPANIEGTGSVTIRDLVKNTLRMRPDRIVVGECRDGAALDMLQAMNTGHDGSLTTIHANNPHDCLSRLETLVMMAGMDLPSKAIRDQVASAVDIIVQVARLSDGSRKIIAICEVTGIDNGSITLEKVVEFKQTGVDHNGKVIGSFQFTGHTPQFIHDLEKNGLRVPKGFFSKRSVEG